jgi:hypothetical protein
MNSNGNFVPNFLPLNSNEFNEGDSFRSIDPLKQSRESALADHKIGLSAVGNKPQDCSEMQLESYVATAEE